MVEVKIKDSDLKAAAAKGMDEFLQVFTDAILAAVGGEITQDNLDSLNSEQLTLLAYIYLRDEVMEGGFVQLIHNGYGGFIYLNPFEKVVREWGIADLKKIISKTHVLYNKYHKEIEKDWNQEEFDALYERFPEFDDYDDAFVENEETFTSAVAHYVDEHIENFATIENE
jgi:hypothetical protein